MNVATESTKSQADSGGATNVTRRPADGGKKGLDGRHVSFAAADCWHGTSGGERGQAATDAVRTRPRRRFLILVTFADIISIHDPMQRQCDPVSRERCRRAGWPGEEAPGAIFSSMPHVIPMWTMTEFGPYYFDFDQDCRNGVFDFSMQSGPCPEPNKVVS